MSVIYACLPVNFFTTQYITNNILKSLYPNNDNCDLFCKYWNDVYSMLQFLEHYWLDIIHT